MVISPSNKSWSRKPLLPDQTSSWQNRITCIIKVLISSTQICLCILALLCLIDFQNRLYCSSSGVLFLSLEPTKLEEGQWNHAYFYCLIIAISEKLHARYGAEQHWLRFLTTFYELLYFSSLHWPLHGQEAYLDIGVDRRYEKQNIEPAVTFPILNSGNVPLSVSFRGYCSIHKLCHQTFVCCWQSRLPMCLFKAILSKLDWHKDIL